jgi:uncharacterized protein YfaS (alpha-2-macroglobulin family)
MAVLCLIPLSLAAETAKLEVASAGPTGELARREQAREIRVVFSEPMVELGKIPAKVEAPFFSIRPAVEGSLRWSGTKTLIFTPGKPLPWGTKFDVTIASGATAVSGRTLAAPYRFSFQTPGVRLMRLSWYRRGGKSDGPIVLVLQFNQPVRASAIARSVKLAYTPHAWSEPKLPAGIEHWRAVDPGGLEQYRAKIARARAAASATDAVPFQLARTWDVRTFPRNPETVVLQTTTAPRVGTSLEVSAGDSGSVTLLLEPMFFIGGLRCETACDPDDYNPLQFSTRFDHARFARAVRVTDVTDPRRPIAVRRKPAAARETTDEEDVPDANLYPRSQERWENRPEFWAGAATLDYAGYSLEPGRTYAVRVDPSLKAADGQTLGYSWIGTIENWHRNAFTSFGSGHGVWEASGGPQLPFHARNLRTLTQWLAPVSIDRLAELVARLGRSGFDVAPPDAKPITRRLSPVVDQVQSYGLDLKSFLSPAGTGVFWAAVKNGEPVPKAHMAVGPMLTASLVQVTHLGISVKDSPDNTLVFVTRLEDAAPVAGAKVSIRMLDDHVVWSGTTGSDGVAIAPDTPLRDPRNWYQLRFIVTAEKDGDLAYVASDWTQGNEPWMFSLDFELEEAFPLLRAAVFTDRGVYRLGEEVHFKTIARSDTARGVVLMPPGTKAEIVVRDSQGAETDKRTVALSEWGSAEWTWKLPADAPLGQWRIEAKVEGQKREGHGSFLVAAFRRPDFRVDATLKAPSTIAGTKLTGLVAGRYLFGAPMAERSVHWTYTRKPVSGVPAAVRDRFPEEQWEFLPQWDARLREVETLESKEEKLDASGEVRAELPTRADSPWPYEYSLEGEVTDVSRQKIAGRATYRVDPAPWYLAVRRLPYFADSGKPVVTEIAAVDLAGRPQPDVHVSVDVRQVQWHAVRRASGRGFYTWESEKKEVDAGHFDVATAASPVRLEVPVAHGGYYVLTATAKDGEGRQARTDASFYALGAGYTAWERYDHNRIDLVPEKKTYRPGQTARILVKSPWERATALLTTEREGVRSHRTFTLTSTQETVEVPIDAASIPNVYVSVLLVKGRTGGYDEKDASDPGKPAFRLGYTELKVESAEKRLAVEVSSDAAEYRPAASAKVRVSVRDAAGKPDSAEVTLWAVDYGVLSLTAYRTPDPVGSIWVDKAIAVLNEDSRLNIISRRATIPKGAAEGGGGGAEEGPGSPVRKDFRVLAFWLGSVVTDARGEASAEVKLPESLTTYRIMAVAGDKSSRFGRGEKEILVRKPVLLRAAFPRFLAVGDRAFFGAVAHNETKSGGTATVTVRSLDPRHLEIAGESRRSVQIPAGGSSEVRFTAVAKTPGRARVRMSLQLGSESDAFEEVLPVELPISPEVVAAYGQVTESAKESVKLPSAVIADFGGLHVELASTALVNLGEGARYLVDYPYGCAEQRSSAAMALMLAADLGRAFSLPGIDADHIADVSRATVQELPEFQCGDGGFSFWKKDCRSTSPYLTSYVVWVLQRAVKLSYPVPAGVLEKAYGYLEEKLGEKPPANEGWWPAYTAWQAFAVKVLAEGGRNVDAHVTRLYGHADRMPVFGLAYLWDAMAAKAERGDRPLDLKRRIQNAILPEGGSAHVEELADPYLLWFWNSNVRSTAIVLGSVVRNGGDPSLVPGLVRWLLAARKNGRWGNTQENGVAMAALVDYYRKFESETPAFQARVTLAEKPIASERFEGRSTEARAKDVPMKDLLGRGAPGTSLPFEFRKEGTGTLHYAARLTYASADPKKDAMDQGFRIERSFAVVDEKSGETAAAEAGTRFPAGSLVRVALTLDLTKERRFVAVNDPLPAGFEPVESWFATTASKLAGEQRQEESGGDWMSWWQHGGFDRVERHDDRVLLFATRLSEGRHVFTYLVRATTAGTFETGPVRVEEMYEPEVFGRSSSAVVEVEK